MKEIVIMESLNVSAEEMAARKKPFEEQGCVFKEYARTTDKAVLIEQAKHADAMIIANMPMPWRSPAWTMWACLPQKKRASP